MSFADKFKGIQKKATVNAFLKKEAADDALKKADKARRGGNEDTARQLKKEGEQLRAEQRQAEQLRNKMGLGEKILRGYFAYKLCSLACHTLVGMTGAEAYRNGLAAGMAHSVTNGINDTIDKQSEKIANDIEQGNLSDERAKMIEDTLQSFENISDQAQEQGISQEPLLTDADRENLRDLAEASRSDDVEQYVAKCRDLGLDETEARTAFEQDRTFDDVSREVEQTAEKEKDQEQSYEMEV